MTLSADIAPANRETDTGSVLLAPPPLVERFPLSIVPRIMGRERRFGVIGAPQEFRPSQAQLDCYNAFREIGDPVADALVAAMKSAGSKQLRAQFSYAVDHGIDSVPDAPQVLRDFFAEVESVPYWVDFEEVDRGAEVLLSLGPLAAPMSFIGLTATYISPDGNAVMFRSGDTRYKAGSRAVETLSWLKEATEPGALRHGGAGYKATVRLRLTHAFIRSGMQSRPDWDATVDALPINQQIYGTVISVFAVYPMAGAMALGMWHSHRDRAAVFHLWRYIAHIIGVHPAMIPTNEADAMRVMWIYLTKVDKPDGRAREMGEALVNAFPEIYGVTSNSLRDRAARSLLRHFHNALARLTLGANYAESLGYGRVTPLAYPLTALPFVLFQLSSLLDVVPMVRHARLRLMSRASTALIDRISKATNADLTYVRE